MVVRVLICDKYEVVRTGLRALLAPEPDIEVVDTTDSGLHAVLLARTHSLDVVVTGLELLSLSGLELVRRLAEQDAAPAPRVVVYAAGDTEESVADVLHAGASGFLVRDAGRVELAAAIRAVANGEAMLAPAVAQRLVNWFRSRDVRPEPALHREAESLTPREREVLLLLAGGLQPEEIAGRLFIGVTTVRTHIYRLRGKLGLRDRAQLVSFAYRAGFMSPA
ncbi:DNA-binding response regulator [Actinoplanes sp. NBRC 14428]|nr:DNA-binding response regulator [Actinoplanes sp. NBRC 14428]